MKGYPKTVATKADFEILLADPLYRVRAKKDLEAIYSADDSKATVATAGTIDFSKPGDQAEIIKIIDNPMPLWKRKGFKSRVEVEQLIQKRSS